MLTSSVLPLQLCRRLMQLRHLLLETLTVLVLVPHGDFITAALLLKNNCKFFSFYKKTV